MKGWLNVVKGFSFFICFLVVSCIGCRNHYNGFDSTGSTQNSKIEDFFKITPLSKNASSDSALNFSPDGGVSVKNHSVSFELKDSHDISIAKSMLDKEYMLQAALIPQTGLNTGGGILTRIVKFKKDGESLLLIQSSDGFVPDSNLPSTLLLTTFPILYEDEVSIHFDFNKGFKNLYTGPSWSTGPSASFFGEGIKVEESFVRDAKFINGNLAVFQIVQTIDSSRDVKSLEVRYFIRPYISNPNFKPATNTNYNDYRFFSAKVRTIPELGGDIAYLTKWDITKRPITYYVSSNTPAEYVDAVKEGILYWNAALGEQLFKVEIAPDGVTAPYPGYNIAQWIENDIAGFAYADAHTDPRTGEILQAQVFINSSFVAKIKSFNMLKFSAKPHDKNSTESFIEERHGCLYPTDGFDSALGDDFIKAKLPKEVLDRVKKAWLTGVVAHEVGHTMGLAHNFAGNLISNVAGDKRQEMWKKYLQTGSVPRDAIMTSSIMDYNSVVSKVLAVENYKAFGRPLLYDKTAIRKVYLNKEFPDVFVPYCSDGEVGRYFDCVPHDFGASAFWENLYTKKTIKDNFYLYFVGALADLKTNPEYEGRRNILDFNVNFGPILKLLVDSYSLAFEVVTQNSESVFSSRNIGSASSFKEARNSDITKRINDTLNDVELQKAFGFDPMVELASLGFDDNWVSKQIKLLSEFLEVNSNRTIETIFGIAVFNEEDVRKTKILFDAYLREMKDESENVEKSIWTRPNSKFRSFSQMSELEKLASGILIGRLFKDSENFTKAEKLFNLNAAESLAKETRGDYFFYDAKLEVKSRLLTLAKTILGVDNPDAIKIAVIAPEKRVWAKEFISVWQLFKGFN